LTYCSRALRTETVDEMSRNQIGEMTAGVIKTAAPALSHDAEFFPGMVKKWGLAYLISTEEAPTGRSAGSVCWAGLANTYFWIDPGRRVAGVFASQLLPFADPAVLDAFAAFERAVYASRVPLAR
jgi:methyl acetate hydrolase